MVGRRPSNWPARRYGVRKGREAPESLRRWVLKKYPVCWLAIPGRCSVVSTEVHHVIPAQDGGKSTKQNLRGVCSECHRYVSARDAQRRSVAAQVSYKRQPEPHPGILRDDEV